MSDVDGYLEALPASRRQRIFHFMQVIETAVPGMQWELWNSGSGILGYGRYSYRYATGRTGEWMQIGVSNRARYVALYASCADETRSVAADFRDRLPKCKFGKSCIEVPDAATVDDEVLADLAREVTDSFRAAMEKPDVPGTLRIRE